MSLWPIQEEFVRLSLDAVARGVQSACITAPTGTGKSKAITKTIEELARGGKRKAILYTSRKWLIEQLGATLDAAGIDFGIRAAEFDDDAEYSARWPVQISMIPTETKRVLVSQRWNLFGEGEPCTCIIDEGHMNRGPQVQELYQRHRAAGHNLLFVTATPVGMEQVCDELLIAGSVSDGFKCGALVPAFHYGPDEPDIRRLGNKVPAPGVEFTAGQVKKLMDQVGLYGRIWDNWTRINPEQKPTLCFADSVEKSLWIAQQFTERGVPAAHIDADEVWMFGEWVKTTKDARRALIEASRAGDIKVICNRFIAREGIDMPWLRCVIVATVFGSIQSYLQSLGRGMRADNYEDTVALWGRKEHVDIIDHGGNWWRHGSVNEDREWELWHTSESVADRRARGFRSNSNAQPFVCPQCKRVWDGRGLVCSHKHGGCGYTIEPRKKYARAVVTTEGELKLTNAQVFRPRRTYGTGNREHGGPKRWERMYWRARSAKVIPKMVDGHLVDVQVGWAATFKQAFALFAQENNWGWPDPAWPFMPKFEQDEYRLVGDVPMDRLIPKIEESTDGGRDDDPDDGGTLFPQGSEEGGSAETSF